MAINDNDAGIQEVSDNGPQGARMGKTSSDKIAFLGATPVAQQASSSFTTTLAATTTTTATTTALQADIDAIRTRVNDIADALNTFGFTAAS